MAYRPLEHRVTMVFRPARRSLYVCANPLSETLSRRRSRSESSLRIEKARSTIQALSQGSRLATIRWSIIGICISLVASSEGSTDPVGLFIFSPPICLAVAVDTFSFCVVNHDAAHPRKGVYSTHLHAVVEGIHRRRTCPEPPTTHSIFDSETFR